MSDGRLCRGAGAVLLRRRSPVVFLFLHSFVIFSSLHDLLLYHGCQLLLPHKNITYICTTLYMIRKKNRSEQVAEGKS